ncbi:hypothetical protein [Spelaeicoccus albus]|uniref:Uncharacterized protein n=1 Tax=Spelaeicoccus albus TaxID=1280376 RepID=A0A7Z0D1W4_9MICO|nr:hypothetical protein [Spelaeicoccus albus]NYI67015.1 hypothetical protein [Spelaeicoccus albus]
MRKDDLIKGRKYALRPKGSGPGEPFIKATFIGPARGRQCRIRYEDGELEDLEEWVHTRLIACVWGERKFFLRDEERAARLAKADAELWDPVTEEAISAVMTASGEYTGFLRRWDTDPVSAERYWARGGVEGTPLEDDPANYQDRGGVWHLSFRSALKAARAFAAADPEMVDLYLRGWEEELKAEGFEPGGRHSHDLLRKWAPSHALVRAWSQVPRGVAAEMEIERLRALVSTAVRYLYEAGEDSKAGRIERGLHGR